MSRPRIGSLWLSSIRHREGFEIVSVRKHVGEDSVRVAVITPGHSIAYTVAEKWLGAEIDPKDARNALDWLARLTLSKNEPETTVREIA